jgi:RNA polymerase sigma-70 factor, ECF subfamily
MSPDLSTGRGAPPSADASSALMARVARGDRAAFRALVETHQGAVTNFIHHLIADQGRAEELAQDVFLQVYRAAPRYRPDARFTTWLHRIATNVALNALRARTRRPTVSLDVLESDDRGRKARVAVAPREAWPDRVFERDELVRVVGRAIRSLPERQRIAVVLHRYEGLSYEAIAEVMSSSPDAVDALLRRAKAALRDALTLYVGPRP